MLDMKFIRENPDAVRENIKKKFQDEKLPLVDEVLDLDTKRRAAIAEADQLRSNRNQLSKQIGMLMGQAKKDPGKLQEAEAVKQQVKEQAERLAELEKLEVELEGKLHHDMLLIPQMIDPSVPIGKDDSENVEVQRFGECKVPDFPIPYHVDIMESFDGIEERGIYRIHQFEKQEMIVVCKPEESKDWYEKLWQMSVELFRSLDIPVRQLECCSGDLADLKVKSCDIEAWSPRQQKFFEVCSCSNLGDAQARRLRIRYKDENGKMQLCHTLNNTCVAPPRMLIAFLENNLQADGTVKIPEVLRPYMGGKELLVPKK